MFVIKTMSTKAMLQQMKRVAPKHYIFSGYTMPQESLQKVTNRHVQKRMPGIVGFSRKSYNMTFVVYMPYFAILCTPFD